MLFPFNVKARIVLYERIEFQNTLAKENTLYADKEVAEKLLEAYSKRSNGLNQSVKGVMCSCVLYSQSLGMPLKGYGLAKNYPVKSKIPALQGFVVTYESKLGHMASYTLDGDYIVLKEANYSRCKQTSGRRLKIDSPVIKGFL